MRRQGNSWDVSSSGGNEEAEGHLLHDPGTASKYCPVPQAPLGSHVAGLADDKANEAMQEVHFGSSAVPSRNEHVTQPRGHAEGQLVV